MDKELLRLVIIVSGAVIFVLILLWGVLANRRSRKKVKGPKQKDPLGNIDESLVIHTENDEFDIIPLGSALDDDPDLTIDSEEIFEESRNREQEERLDEHENYENLAEGTAEFELPDVIQFSIRAPENDDFNGAVLIPALESVGLVYGDLKIFERLDDKNLVDFGVASMVKPGTFPEQDLESFSCPGIVFFMQPKEVDEPLAVFDDLVSTVVRLTQQLGGKAQDHQMQSLTQETVDLFRKQMAG